LNRDPGRLSRLARLGVGALVALALPAWTFGQPAPAQPPARVEEKRVEVQLTPTAEKEAVILSELLVEDPASDRDKKIAELERKLQQLRAELAALRAQQSQGQPAQPRALTVQVRPELVQSGTLTLQPRPAQSLLQTRPVQVQSGTLTLQPSGTLTVQP